MEAHRAGHQAAVSHMDQEVQEDTADGQVRFSKSLRPSTHY